ncbi:hypothetical protein WDV93_14510 [Pantoea ananatis]
MNQLNSHVDNLPVCRSRSDWQYRFAVRPATSSDHHHCHQPSECKRVDKSHYRFRSGHEDEGTGLNDARIMIQAMRAVKLLLALRAFLPVF